MGFEIKDGVLKKYTAEPGVKRAVIPDGVVRIGEYAFEGCTGLTSVTIPDSVREIMSGAFYGCTRLRSIVIPEGVTKLESRVFSLCTDLTAVVIPDSVTELGQGAFLNCSGLTSFTIPACVTVIGKRAFWGCTGLRDVIIPDSVAVIGEEAFKNHTGLTVTLPENITKIGRDAFAGCESVTYRNITFAEDPQSVVRFHEVVLRVVDMVRNKNYDVEITDPVKYTVLWQLFCFRPDEKELCSYIKMHFLQVFVFAIVTGNKKAVEAVCKAGGFLDAYNIDICIEQAIRQQQIEIQLMLMNYKNEHIGYGHNEFKL